MDRRDFLTRLGFSLAVLPTAARAVGAATWRPRIGASWRGTAADSRYRAGVLRADPDRGVVEILGSAELPGRAHGLLAERDGSLLVVAVRPGSWLLRLDPPGRVARQLVLDEAAGNRRFNGPVGASADGTRL